MTCADCDLSGRCPCVMRRLERLRAKGLMTADPSDGTGPEPEPLLSNEELFASAMNLLREINKG